MNEAIILGCGPAGLLAAHAATLRGYDPVIISNKNRSLIFAAMYLHRSIPHITPNAPELEIDVVKVGCREGYAENVYGDPTAPVSWDKFEPGPTPGWNMAKAYDALWKKYSDKIVDKNVNVGMLNRLASLSVPVFSTIPATHTCDDPNHRFEKQKIWVLHGPAGRFMKKGIGSDTMYYNGYTLDGRYGMIGFEWYRYSQLNGYQSWEYASDDPPRNLEAGKQQDGNMTLSLGYKPLRTDCDCHPGIRRLGRFGRWDKSVLSHHVFEEVYDALQ
jgi:hypothetical protein